MHTSIFLCLLLLEMTMHSSFLACNLLHKNKNLGSLLVFFFLDLYNVKFYLGCGTVLTVHNVSGDRGEGSQIFVTIVSVESFQWICSTVQHSKNVLKPFLAASNYDNFHQTLECSTLQNEICSSSTS